MESLKPVRTTLAPAARWVRHAIEMCAVMCIGAVSLNVLIWGGAALLGYNDLTQRFPELSALVVTLTLTLPMAAWMRLRGHDWQQTIEMTGPTAITGTLLIGAFWLSMVSTGDLIQWQLRLACPVMFAVMLVRFRYYSRGHAAHHAGHVVPLEPLAGMEHVHSRAPM